MHAIIEKLPSSWQSVVVSLRHKREAMNLDNLMISLQIEERQREKEKLTLTDSSNANLVEKNKKNNHKKKNYKKFKDGLKPKSDINKNNNNFKRGCFVCGKPGHFARNCRHRKDKNDKASEAQAKQANVVTIATSDVSDVGLQVEKP